MYKLEETNLYNEVIEILRSSMIDENQKISIWVELFESSSNPLVQAVLKGQTTFSKNLFRLRKFYETASRWNPWCMTTLISDDFIQEADKVNRAFNGVVMLNDGPEFDLVKTLSIDGLYQHVKGLCFSNILVYLVLIFIITNCIGYFVDNYVTTLLLSLVLGPAIIHFVGMYYYYRQILHRKRMVLARVAREVEVLDEIADIIRPLIGK